MGTRQTRKENIQPKMNNTTWEHLKEGALVAAKDNLRRLPKDFLVSIYSEWAAFAKAVELQMVSQFDPIAYSNTCAWILSKDVDKDFLVEGIWEKAQKAGKCNRGGQELWMCPYGCVNHCVSVY